MRGFKPGEEPDGTPLMTALPLVRATRVTSRIRRGSSLPVVVETARGRFVVKLRGAAQGTLPLIAEIIVAELCGLLRLPVPERTLVTLDEDVPSDDKNDELADLLARSRGINLGFRYLEGAIDVEPRDVASIERDFATATMWLDGLVMNADRSARNSNILLWHKGAWLIDHGACLPFQHDIAHVREEDPRAPSSPRGHLLFARIGDAEKIDELARASLSRAELERAVGCVPPDFIAAAFPNADAEHVRALYVAFLWKRLKPPRPFWLDAPSSV